MAAISGSSIAGIIISLLVIFILIFNVVYINGVRAELAKPNTSLSLSKTGADIIFWTDIVLILLTGAYLIWNIVKIFTTTEQRTTAVQVLTTSNTGIGVPVLKEVKVA